MNGRCRHTYKTMFRSGAKRARVLVVVLVLLAGGSPPGPAQSANGGPSAVGAVTAEKLAQGAAVADLIRYAYDRNPSLKVAREGWAATVEKFRIVTGYPDPELMLTYFPRSH